MCGPLGACSRTALAGSGGRQLADQSSCSLALGGPLRSAWATRRIDASPLAWKSNLITNDWSTNPNGEAYLHVGTAESPDLQGRVLDVLAEVQPRIDAVNRDFKKRYGWTAAPKAPKAAPAAAPSSPPRSGLTAKDRKRFMQGSRDVVDVLIRTPSKHRATSGD
jgi:hypothetical protein